jgi:quercetin dioxygenase-like cupin family protein
MNPANFDEFQTRAQAQGFDEALVREWAPGQVLDTHTHPFSVKALVVRGSLVLTCDGQPRPLRAGDWFELPREAPHAEHYGPDGATFWVARRHGG